MYDSDTKPTNKPRWRIFGTLGTVGPLHIGCGALTYRDEIRNEKTGKPAELNAVATDHIGRAYVPGSTVKGNLRAWLEARNEAKTKFLFGTMDKENQQGGRAEFMDAFFLKDSVAGQERGRWWSAKRKTCVAPGVTIDRVTRTALDERLYYHEYVPPGIEFGVEIVIRDVDSADEFVPLLAALEAFRREDGPTLGAGSGDGWGRMTWKLEAIERTDRVEAWLKGEAPSPWTAIPENEMAKLRGEAADGIPGGGGAVLEIPITIRFESQFLVNDPSRAKPKESAKRKDDQRPNHAALLAGGNVVLPASSLRGAFRSQAERILRTMATENEQPHRDPAAVAPVEGIAKAKGLPLCSKLFGAAGWRAPIEFSDFVPAADSSEPTPGGVRFRQEFVAIDRFTGGGEDGKKFNAEGYYRPVLTGRIRIDRGRLKEVGAEPEALGLVMLAMRDLQEGDIPLGFGAAKGYGACKAKVAMPAEASRWVEAFLLKVRG